MSETPRRKPRRLGPSTAPIVVGLGTIVGYQILVRLVPGVWSQILPGGFDQAASLGGLPRLVWRAAWSCHDRFALVLAGSIAATLIAGVLARSPATRPLAWLMAVVVLAVDAAILFVMIRAGMAANGLGAVLG